MRYAVISEGKIMVRAIPLRLVASRIAKAEYPYTGKVIIDPRSIQR